MQLSMADQLQHIDSQLLQCELLPGEQAAVDEFMVWSLQLRQERHHLLGPYPAGDMVERSAWQARKEQMDAAVEPEIESEKMLRGETVRLSAFGTTQAPVTFKVTACLTSTGLESAWEKHQERERLRQLRFNLLGGQEVGMILKYLKVTLSLLVSGCTADLFCFASL